MSLTSIGQVTFSDILSLENKSYKEVQAYMIPYFTIIEDDKYYRYIPYSECSPPQYDDDGCRRICHQLLGGWIQSKYLITNPVFENNYSNENYEVNFFKNSSFAENYDPQTKRGTTFIDIYAYESWDNLNCKGEFNGKSSDETVTIKIQFAEFSRWESFKRSVAQKATFQDTYTSDNQPIELSYGIRRELSKSGYWTGVSISLWEGTDTFHAEISFNKRVD